MGLLGVLVEYNDYAFPEWAHWAVDKHPFLWQQEFHPDGYHTGHSDVRGYLWCRLSGKVFIYLELL